MSPARRLCCCTPFHYACVQAEIPNSVRGGKERAPNASAGSNEAAVQTTKQSERKPSGGSKGSTGGQRGSAQDRAEKARPALPRLGGGAGGQENRRTGGGRGGNARDGRAGASAGGSDAGGGKSGRGGGHYQQPANGITTRGSATSTSGPSVPVAALPVAGVQYYPGVPFGVMQPAPLMAATPGQPQIPESQPAALEMLRNQVTFYFSIENLLRDTFLRRQMSNDGWVPVDFIAGFQRCRHFVFWLLQWDASMHSVYANGTEAAVIVAALSSAPTPTVELSDNGRSLRRRDNWQQWVLAPAQRDKRPAVPAAGAAQASKPAPPQPPPGGPPRDVGSGTTGASPPAKAPPVPPPSHAMPPPAAQADAAPSGSAPRSSSLSSNAVASEKSGKPPRPAVPPPPPAAAVQAARATVADDDDDMFEMDEVAETVEGVRLRQLSALPHVSRPTELAALTQLMCRAGAQVSPAVRGATVTLSGRVTSRTGTCASCTSSPLAGMARAWTSRTASTIA